MIYTDNATTQSFECWVLFSWSEQRNLSPLACGTGVIFFIIRLCSPKYTKNRACSAGLSPWGVFFLSQILPITLYRRTVNRTSWNNPWWARSEKCCHILSSEFSRHAESEFFGSELLIHPEGLNCTGLKSGCYMQISTLTFFFLLIIVRRRKKTERSH